MRSKAVIRVDMTYVAGRPFDVFTVVPE